MNFCKLLKPVLAGVALSCTQVIPQIHAQTSDGRFTFAWGEAYKLPKKHNDLGFIGNEKDGYIQLSHNRRESLVFQKFDNKLHLTGETETDLSNLPRNHTNENVVEFGGKYYWFFSTLDKGEDKENLYAQEVDLTSGSIMGSAREIVSTSRLASGYDMKLGFTFMTQPKQTPVKFLEKWNFLYSFDNSKMLVQYRKKPEFRNDRKNTDIIGFHVYDNSMKKIWGREIRMPYTEKEMDNEDYSVDSKGNVYTLAKVYEGGNSGGNRSDYHFEILKWSADKEEAAIIPFKLTDKFVNAAYITEDGLGNIVAGGYYTNRHKSGTTDGVFLLKLDDATNEMHQIMKGIYPFPLNIMKQYESAGTRRKMERKEEKGKLEQGNLTLKKIVLKADGSIQIFGEESYFIIERSRSVNTGITSVNGNVAFANNVGGMSSRTTYHYYYNDILAMDIAPTGDVNWIKKIPKAQHGFKGLGGMSFMEMNYKDDTYLFFMDNKKNLDIAVDKAPAMHRDGSGGILMAVKIDKSGKMKKSKVFNVRQDKVNLTVSKFDQVGVNQMIVRGRAKKRNSQAALVTFQ